MMDTFPKYLKNLLRKKGVKQLRGLPKEIKLGHVSTAKRVIKPWGFELWIADGKSSSYALKIIYLKKGTKTSLQYHKKKTEHNFIFSGKAKFCCEDSRKKTIQSCHLSSGGVVEIKPSAIHRIEAITDLILIEASTSHLDDVIRLEDDYKRSDGKIEEEHRIS